MDFKWAIEQMKLGKTVQRNQYKDTLYKYHVNLKEPMNWVETQSGDFAHLRLSDFEATDWELFEENFNLSEKFHTVVHFYDDEMLVKLEDIKEFIRHIKKEIPIDQTLSRHFGKELIEVINKLAGERFK